MIIQAYKDINITGIDIYLKLPTDVMTDYLYSFIVATENILATTSLNPVKFSFSNKNLSGMKLSEVLRNEKYHDVKAKIFFLWKL